MRLSEISKKQLELDAQKNNPNYDWAKHSLTLNLIDPSGAASPVKTKITGERFPRDATEIDLTNFQLNISDEDGKIGSFDPPFILKNSRGGWYHTMHFTKNWEKLQNADRASNGFIGCTIDLTDEFVRHFTERDQRLQFSGCAIKWLSANSLIELVSTPGVWFGPHQSFITVENYSSVQNLKLNDIFKKFIEKKIDAFDLQDELVSAGFQDMV